MRVKVPPLAKSPQLLQPPQLRKAASVRDDPAALAKRRSRLHELRAASSSSGSGGGGGSEAAAAFTKRESKRDRRRALDRGASSSSGGSSGESTAMRKSHSLDAAESYSLASIQAPLWVTLTNARTIEELAQQKL